MLYLVCEVKSGLGEDTFWTWFERQFSNIRFLKKPVIPSEFDPKVDCMIVYSTMGPIVGRNPSTITSFCLAWELYPEMKLQLDSKEWDKKIATTQACARSTTQTLVASSFAIPFYETHAKNISKMELGVNTDLFRPLGSKEEKRALREKHGIPVDARVAYWGGTSHRMKGFNGLIEYAKANPDVFWILVWKTPSERVSLGEEYAWLARKEFGLIKQHEMAELLGLADFFLCTSKLRPYYMTEYEAMACDLPFEFTEALEKDFSLSKHPRTDLLHHGWDRKTVLQKWMKLFDEYGVEYVRRS